ncbi:hypothetical protein GRX03_01985 [Halovenus sp. WSH3]|uniref:Uncharacterized protein n=1 Tax=Halovenus carboxidivorans TaxID=2692199 RepID=A0A6B0SXE0_9EURY|nr:hypothetical protein [Halovenus carboxidivorans]MXR50378.1 hypothetical protein [Halovenus carboxidivorans]
MAVDAADALGELPRTSDRLDVEANLGVEIDGRSFAVSSEGDRVVVHAPSVSACLVAADQRTLLPALAETAAQAGITVELRTGDAVLAVVGAAAAPDRPTAALFGEAVELRPAGVLAGLVRLR